ncbi:MAG: hypothetical protein ABJN57_01440 [Hyphomicrobiales bacterium]
MTDIKLAGNTKPINLLDSISTLATKKFHEGDGDQDQSLSFEEYRKLHEEGAFSSARFAHVRETEDIFADLDRDNDGSLSEEEFVSSHGEGVIVASSKTFILQDFSQHEGFDLSNNFLETLLAQRQAYGAKR